MVLNNVRVDDEKNYHVQKPLASNTRKGIWPIVTSLTTSLFESQDESIKKRFLGEAKSKNVTTGEAISFYIYHTVLIILFIFFSLYRVAEKFVNLTKLRFLNFAYNPNSDPSVINADVNKLAKIPHKLSSILTFKSEQEEGGGIEGLCNDTAKIFVWCLASGIPQLSIYEHEGILKKNIPQLRKAIVEKLVANFGTESIPKFKINIPHLNISYSGGFDGEYSDLSEVDYDIELSLISYVDGRPTIVELTKVLGELCHNKELKTEDITMEFIDNELKQLVGEEPDLIVTFQPSLDLSGYPPWHIRLSEMYWEPDNEDVTYAVFLRALQKYSSSKVNIGR